MFSKMDMKNAITSQLREIESVRVFVVIFRSYNNIYFRLLKQPDMNPNKHTTSLHTFTVHAAVFPLLMHFGREKGLNISSRVCSNKIWTRKPFLFTDNNRQF